jgi:flagellar hook-associated protein 3 FlgL
MAMRVTQNQMYASSVQYMNKNLSDLMESNLQNSSQLKINRPSDDPVGAGRVISYKASLSQLSRYEDNINTAYGWLGTADSVLSGEGSLMTVLTRMKELAEQGATETYDKNNREQISYELRQAFMQLINLANTRFEDRSIFAGQKTDGPAYTLALGVTSPDENFNAALLAQGAVLTAQGDTDHTTVIQFYDNPPDGASGGTSGPLETTLFRYSTDGGATWETGTTSVAGTDVFLLCGGSTLKISNGAGAGVTTVSPDNPHETDNGTWLYLRPSAVYNGDDSGVRVVTPYGSAVTGAQVQGSFARDVAVRIEAVAAGPPSEVTYSYSLDDGSNWTRAVSSDSSFRLPVPGGYLELGAAPAAGDQFVIHPYRADINMAISDSDSVTVNLVGKDVFGGLYRDPFTTDALPVNSGGTAHSLEGDEANLFEVCGRLVGAAEYGSPDDMAVALEELKTVMAQVATEAAVVGGRYNRLEVTHAALEMRILDETDNLSYVEDVDLTELLIRLSKQQVAYDSVLKSSSMIMQMSLVNFL